MLRDNLKALRIAYRLMGGTPEAASGPSRADLHDALIALNSMIARTENVRTKFAPGTSQHALQRNRLKALRIAEELVRREIERA